MNLNEFKTIEQLAAALKSLDMVTAVPWTPYHDTSTIVGWSSYTTKSIWTKKVGDTVDVYFDIGGTSDDTVATFTVPYAASATGPARFVDGAEVIDNSTSIANAGRIQLSLNDDEINVFKDMKALAFTASNTKRIVGHLRYESA